MSIQADTYWKIMSIISSDEDWNPNLKERYQILNKMDVLEELKYGNFRGPELEFEFEQHHKYDDIDNDPIMAGEKYWRLSSFWGSVDIPRLSYSPNPSCSSIPSYSPISPRTESYTSFDSTESYNPESNDIPPRKISDSIPILKHKPDSSRRYRKRY
jgi:hypothetical protein